MRGLVVDGRRGREGYPGLCVGCSTIRADDSPKLAIVDWLIEHLRAQLAQERASHAEDLRYAVREVDDLRAEHEVAEARAERDRYELRD